MSENEKKDAKAELMRKRGSKGIARPSLVNTTNFMGSSSSEDGDGMLVPKRQAIIALRQRRIRKRWRQRQLAVAAKIPQDIEKRQAPDAPDEPVKAEKRDYNELSTFIEKSKSRRLRRYELMSRSTVPLEDTSGGMRFEDTVNGRKDIAAKNSSEAKSVTEQGTLSTENIQNQTANEDFPGSINTKAPSDKTVSATSTSICGSHISAHREVETCEKATGTGKESLSSVSSTGMRSKRVIIESSGDTSNADTAKPTASKKSHVSTSDIPIDQGEAKKTLEHNIHSSHMHMKQSDPVSEPVIARDQDETNGRVEDEVRSGYLPAESSVPGSDLPTESDLNKAANNRSNTDRLSQYSLAVETAVSDESSGISTDHRLSKPSPTTQSSHDVVTNPIDASNKTAHLICVTAVSPLETIEAETVKYKDAEAMPTASISGGDDSFLNKFSKHFAVSQVSVSPTHSHRAVDVQLIVDRTSSPLPLTFSSSSTASRRNVLGKMRLHVSEDSSDDNSNVSTETALCAEYVRTVRRLYPDVEPRKPVASEKASLAIEDGSQTRRSSMGLASCRLRKQTKKSSIAKVSNDRVQETKQTLRRSRRHLRRYSLRPRRGLGMTCTEYIPVVMNAGTDMECIVYERSTTRPKSPGPSEMISSLQVKEEMKQSIRTRPFSIKDVHDADGNCTATIIRNLGSAPRTMELCDGSVLIKKLRAGGYHKFTAFTRMLVRVSEGYVRVTLRHQGNRKMDEVETLDNTHTCKYFEIGAQVTIASYPYDCPAVVILINVQ